MFQSNLDVSLVLLTEVRPMKPTSCGCAVGHCEYTGQARESALLQVNPESNLGGNTLHEFDRGAALQVWRDWEAPSSALQAVSVKSCWVGVRPVDTRWHAEHNKVEVHSSVYFVNYVEEQAHVLADVG